MKIIAFDLDDTLCFRNTDAGGAEKYRHCQPIPEMIEVVNQCYNDGYEIVIYTARGMSQFSGDRDKIVDQLYDLTKAQLVEWGIKHHRLVMGKIHYDILVDDKALNVDGINNQVDILKRVK